MKQLHAADLIPGDLIDFEPVLAAFPPADDDDFDEIARHKSNLLIAESEMFELHEIERESAGTYVLHTDHLSFAIPSDFTLLVERRY